MFFLFLLTILILNSFYDYRVPILMFEVCPSKWTWRKLPIYSSYISLTTSCKILLCHRTAHYVRTHETLLGYEVLTPL